MTVIEIAKDALEIISGLDINPKTTELSAQKRIAMAGHRARLALKEIEHVSVLTEFIEGAKNK